MPEIRLTCLSPEDAAAVAGHWDVPAQNHRARADGAEVVLAFTDRRYPLDVAEWAFVMGHTDDGAAGSLIGRL